jgi:hypothetical protein
LESFDRLPEEARQEAAAQILKRTAAFDLPPLSDIVLVESAGHVFAELDREESQDA